MGKYLTRRVDDEEDLIAPSRAALREILIFVHYLRKLRRLAVVERYGNGHMAPSSIRSGQEVKSSPVWSGPRRYSCDPVVR